MQKDKTVSVSKGVFVFANGFKKCKKAPSSSWFNSLFTNEPWYLQYKDNWEIFESEIKCLHQKTYSALLNDIIGYINSFNDIDRLVIPKGVIPTATLLTGVNQPDHASQFTSLVDLIRCNVTPHVAMINSQDGSSVKLMVENVVWQLINGQDVLDNSEHESFDENFEYKRTKLRKNQCSMKCLQKWYESSYNQATEHNISPRKKKKTSVRKLLLVIIPDFESFQCNILQDFVMIVSSYISSIPIVLVFGVATSVSALHKLFPYHVSSKLLIKVFHSHSSPVYMNEVLENIFLTHTSPFHISGKAFELLTDVFLFYDFSVAGLIQSIKYCMMDHYYGDNSKSLCCSRDKIEEMAIKLGSEDLENVRRLLSFRAYLEKQPCHVKIKLFEDDKYFKEVLCKELHKLHDYLFSFYSCVRVLQVIVKDLPKNILGKTVREVYSKCSSENFTNTQVFRECMQLINFQSQLKLVESVKNALKAVNLSLQMSSPVKPLRSSPMKNNLSNITFDCDYGYSFMKSVRVHLMMFLRLMENASNEATLISNVTEDMDVDTENVPGNRYKLKEKLLRATRVDRVQSEYEMIRGRFVNYLEEVFSKVLRPPNTEPFHELLFFSDVANVKKQIVGSPRGAIHMALSNPVHYLQCNCCLLPSVESVSDTLPDVCLAYKLHRECGKHINLYDWLQAFAAVLKPNEDDENRYKDASVQARFTHAVAELQFLGFIKSSKRKTDHVMRLTW